MQENNLISEDCATSTPADYLYRIGTPIFMKEKDAVHKLRLDNAQYRILDLKKIK